MKAALLLPLVASVVAAPGGPNPFFGYNPTPAPPQESISSYTSISSFARAYKLPEFIRPASSSESTTFIKPLLLNKPVLSPQSATFKRPALSLRPVSLSQPVILQKPVLLDHQPVLPQPLPLNQPEASSIKPAATNKSPTYYNPVTSYEAPVNYNYDWSVKDDYSENDFTHQETRDGDHTRGSYSVLLPDGRLQTVTYYVDGDSGYVAEVTYRQVKYPAPQPAYIPTYTYG
ncbi:Pro-resilin-like 43 [Homarus americanus]|uniref:Pro-resilin-like 43 n=2 Tax=Homarus americanus TaxID=6706 RepID=A0A8J5JYP5_HOMAM|nr:Pro-resilin-like 43 [Homarus americanus]